jgi:translation initiation factor IF-3
MQATACAGRSVLEGGGDRKIEREVRVNERIRAREVRLIDENGAQLGVMPTYQALQTARQRDLDLIEVAPNAQPPVCRIMDFGKHKYQMQKKEREAHKKTHASEMRLIRLKPQIDQHDLGIKVRKLREMLAEGDKVRIQLRFRGREMSRPQLGHELLTKMAEQVADTATVESYPRLEGRMMNMLLAPRPGARPAAPKKQKVDKPEAEKPAPAPAKPTTESAPSAAAPAPAAPPPPAPAPAPAAPAAKEEQLNYGIGTQTEDTEDGGEAG